MARTIGIILAGGSGQRFGGATPKQFTKLAGKLVIEHTVQVFQRSLNIDEIVVVARAEDADFVWELAGRNGWDKLTRVVNGGADRFASTDSAVQALLRLDGSAKVLFHDAVRPLLDERIVADCVTALDGFDAVDVVIPSSDTLVAVDDRGCITSIPPRAAMRRGQTPQAFRLATIREAYARAAALGRRSFTCDCSVVRAMMPDVEVATVQGAETNLKITTPLDLFLAEKLIQCGGTPADELPAGLDALRGRTIAVLGGSSGIGRAICELAQAHGARVHAASRTAGGVDVADAASVEAWLATVAASGEPIDAVVNAAGILVKKPLAAMGEGEIHELIAVNYAGAINVARASRRHLARSRGVLLNFTSSSYTRGRAFCSIYSSTKCAVVNLTQALAEEWQDEGIRVHCISPERTHTPMRTAAFGAEPADSLLTPEAVAESALATVLSPHTGLIVDVRRDRLLAPA